MHPITRTDGVSVPAWPARAGWDQDRTRRAREALLVNGLLSGPDRRAGVREVIERSWRRCLGESVPSRAVTVRHADAPERAHTLCEAARPVLTRLGDHLGDLRVAMVLSDDTGRIVLRVVNEPRQRDALDNASAAEGFDFSEASIGTNGLGTVIEERRPVVVRGSEHYSEALERFTCAGTPIVEPFGKRIVGTLALASNTHEDHPLMCALATDAGRRIEENLVSLLGEHERALIRCYLTADRSGADPVIVVNDRTVFANTAGLPYLGSESHAMLWTHLSESAPAGSGPARVPLPAGWRDAVVDRVDGGRGRTAFCVRLVPPAPGAPAATGRPRPSGAAVPAAPRPLHPVPDVHRQLAAAAAHRECVALDGGPGTGKLHTASALLAGAFGAPEPMVVDVSGWRDGGGPGPALDAALDAGAGLVLRRVHDLDPAGAGRIGRLAERLASRGADSSAIPLVLTVDLDAAGEHVRALVGRVASIVPLPRLREVPEQIPSLVTRILSALPGEQAATAFSSDALQVLMRWSWPGNVAELRRTVEMLARRYPGGTVRPADLPARIRSGEPGRGLSLMEIAERDAVLMALDRAGGNRTAAAQALGIGRTTLYRKIREHRIEA